MTNIKSRRGVYYNLETSPICATIDNTTYRFSSYKKRDMFLDRVVKAYIAVEKLQQKVYRITDNNEKSFDLEALKAKIPNSVYSKMLYK